MTYGYIKKIRSLVGHMPIILNTSAGLILNDKNEVLLNLRTDTHNWSLPGGYLEYGETFAKACIREMKEDSGLDVRVIRPLHLFDEGDVHYPNGDVAQCITQLFLCEPIGGHLLDHMTDETEGLAYWPLDQLPPLLNWQQEAMLAYAREYLIQHN
ncbi:NUDIX hydrolase [Lacticaseibacillus yichunensis]|uniref:NUDIX hydrolase n=2 Tax=Bacilli TaxID=91061 RepID=A0ABW4CQA9_9LACO|nr:NUDIX domain-containing protein [Lacticaseibacillus yichunensis]